MLKRSIIRYPRGAMMSTTWMEAHPLLSAFSQAGDPCQRRCKPLYNLQSRTFPSRHGSNMPSINITWTATLTMAVSATGPNNDIWISPHGLFHSTTCYLNLSSRSFSQYNSKTRSRSLPSKQNELAKMLVESVFITLYRSIRAMTLYTQYRRKTQTPQTLTSLDDVWAWGRLDFTYHGSLLFAWFHSSYTSANAK